MTESIEVPGGRIAYDVTGDGPLVVLVPGLGDLRSTYRFTVPALVEAGYRVATTDLRGHGASSAGFSSYTNADTGADLAELIDRLGGPAIVAGGSFGGGSAVWLAAERPGLVAGLVLLDAFTRPVPVKPMLVPVLKLLGRSPALWGMYYKSLHKGPKPADLGAHVTAIKANMRESGRMAAAGAMAMGAKNDLDGALARVRVPALVIMGGKDPDFPDPRAEAAAIADGLGGPAETVMIDGAGHYPHAEFPAETNAAVLAFLRQVAPVPNGTA